MKNLFKNLMLVAVAAMAFTACSEDNNEVNEVAKKTVISGVLSFDEDTRSGFVGTETTDNGDGTTTTVYKSAWEGGETIKLFANGLETTATVDEEGKFTAKFDGELPESFFMTVCSPADAWNSQSQPTIANVQTPRANSVDPVAHILQAQNVYVTNGSADAAKMEHQAAYGKMTVNGVDFEISKVELSLVGLPNSYWTDNQTYSYTINANEVEGNVFWFATEAMQIVKEFTVTAYDAEGKAVTKTVDVAAADKTLSFNYGRVSTFSVSGLEAVEVAPKNLVFTSAKWVNDSYSDKLVQFYTEDGATLQLNWYNCGSDAWIVPNTYGFANSGAIYYGGEYSWYENSAFDIDAEIAAGTVVVSVVDGKYYIEFKNLADWDGNVYIESATFTGLISGLQVPDMRTKLAAPSNITSSVDGKTITLYWDAVEGANGYRVKLYSPYDESFEEVVSDTKYVYEAQLYSKQYSFTIMSYANDANTQYRSSDDAYAYVTTGKDPSIWADVVANNIVWDSTNSAFKMTGEVVSGTAWGYTSDYIRLYINESDRPGNNSIKVGTYTGCGSKNPQAGQFGARLSLYWGTTTTESAFGSASTVEVSYDETVGYTIILTHDGKTYGYKGMPEGWVAPSAGGDSGEGGEGGEGGEEPVDPDPEQPEPGVADGTSIATAYTFTSYSTYKDFGYPVMCLSGAENGATFNFESNSSNGFPTGMHKFNDGAWYTALCEYKINGEAQAVDFVKSVIWVEGDNVNGYTVEYIYIVTEGGNGIYYKYDGKFFM